MKETPMLCNTTMARAIDHHEKTETRRLDNLKKINQFPDTWELKEMIQHRLLGLRAIFYQKDDPSKTFEARSPYGWIGDRIWIRETFFKNGDEYIYLANGTCCEQFEQCECSEVGKPKWRPSIHMPQEAARLWLKIVDVQIQRLQNISPESAIAEGIKELERWPEAPDTPIYKHYSKHFLGYGVFDPVLSFFTLWVSIYGDYAVGSNPWVWVYTFEKTEGKGGELS